MIGLGHSCLSFPRVVCVYLSLQIYPDLYELEQVSLYATNGKGEGRDKPFFDRPGLVSSSSNFLSHQLPILESQEKYKPLGGLPFFNPPLLLFQPHPLPFFQLNLFPLYPHHCTPQTSTPGIFDLFHCHFAQVGGDTEHFGVLVHD